MHKSGLFFGHCEKNSRSEKLKTQAKSRKKLKQNPEKTQKPPTPVEFRWWIFVTNPKVFPIFAHVVNF